MKEVKCNGRILIGGAGQAACANTQLLYFTCSSIGQDDEQLYMIRDQDGNPNVITRNLMTGEEKTLTRNSNGILKSYVYFSGTPQKGLGKASVSLDAKRNVVYFIQDEMICKVDLNGRITILNNIPDGRMTAFTHVSADGRYVCVPMTDARCLDFDPTTEGCGLDQRPVYNIDGRIQQEQLSSYLCVYDTETGVLQYEKKIPQCWITHVQFNPVNSEQIMYNHEWPSFSCGIRRIWLYDHATDEVLPIRTEGINTLGNSRGFQRTANDWICHEMWTDDGSAIIYHGGYENGPAMVGKYELCSDRYWEIALPDDYDAYGHFTMDHEGNLVCDGYFKYPWEIKQVRENSTDNGPDPHKKDAEYICKVLPDWNEGNLTWIPLCKHESDWLGQDAHPHPIYTHSGDQVFFSSRINQVVNVYSVSCKTPS